MNQNALCFCPHCGEDLRALAQPAAAAPQGAARNVVVRREVTRQEIEALWGLMPLPFGVRPVGVVVAEGSSVPLALAGEGKEGPVELRAGQMKQMDMATPVPAQPPQPTTQPTVPPHVCGNSAAQREADGRTRYGGVR